ncbi:MAG: peptidylprolyl isomerase [Porticoccus sp.]|nr:peptidylprolyl isomerase [Porticoccus sp.]
MNVILQRFLREPLFHFILIGGLFFLIYSTVNDTYGNSTDTIVITPDRIRQIETEFKGVWNREPSDEELDSLIKGEVRSEVYYRDALALRLDENDAVVRRRLRQKMEFLTDTGVYLQQPSESELASYFTANEQNYRIEPRLAFEQIYLGKSSSKDLVVQTLALLSQDQAINSATIGQSTLLPAQLKLSQPAAIDSVFGKGFYHQIVELTPGEWAGPVTSVYGTHLVRTLDGQPGRIPALEDIRDSVINEWKTSKALENREQDYIKRRNRYTVEILGHEKVAAVIQ